MPANRRPGPRQLLDPLTVPTNQRLLFRSRPTFNLLLERDCAFTRLELALPQQRKRLARRRVTHLRMHVLIETGLQIIGLADVIGVVRATEKVDVESFHLGKGFDKLSPTGWGGIGTA